MTTTIHPIVLETLHRFNRRRRRLIVWRGVCSSLAVWFATMITAALIDRFVLIPDGLRLGLSLAGYIATGVVFWFECGRQLTHRPDARELARLLELAAPQLREKLLAAVELAEGEMQPHWDSDEFRAALQQVTANDVGAVHIKDFLTQKLIAGWVYAAVAAVGVLFLLLSLPGLRFSQSFARVVAPVANLARYSNIKITVTAPTPPDRIAPEGDSVPVTVAVTGADVQQVILEIFQQHGPVERTPMLLSAVNQFTTAIQLNQTPIQFRIRAHDAITRKYTLTPRPRPHVVKFHKIYHFPAYSQLPTKTVTEENGDLDALEDTEVELTLAVDQPIKAASLQFDVGTGPAAKSETLLEQAGNRRLTARVPLTASGSYQVRLIAAVTGFENKYSPQYEIRVHPDLIPFAKIDKPEKDELVLPPDSVVNLTGTAKDDLALARVDQLIQVNRGAWQTVPLAQTNCVETKVARSWDLFELGIHPGDRVITKLVATDLKGQRGESAPLRIRIATASFDPDRLNALKDRQLLDKSIHDFRDAADQLDTKTREARAVINNQAADQLQKKQALLAATAAADSTERKAKEVVRQIKDTLPSTTRDWESADLALIGTAISRAQHEDVASVKAALARATEQVNTGDAKVTKADLEKILDQLATGTALARTADDTHRQLLDALEATAALRDLQQLAAEQRTLSEQLRAPTNDVAQTERVAHRQAVVAVETKSIEEQLQTLAGAPGSAANIARNLALSRENLEKVLSTEPTIETLKTPTEQLQHSVENAVTTLHNTSRDLDQRADAARKNLQEQTGTAADAVAKITAQPDRWHATAEELNDRAALEERRPHPDAPFIAAVGKTADAVRALDAAGTNALASTKEIESALRKLETGHAIAEQVSTLHELAAQEHWEKPTTPADAAQRAGEWKSVQQQMQALPQQLTRAQLPAETKRAVEAALNSPATQQINREMTQRQTAPDSVNNMTEPLTKLADDLTQVKQQLQPALDQARAEIDKRAPALSDRLAGLANTAAKLKADTTAQAQQAAKPENANQVRPATQNLAATQQLLDKRVDDVKDTLRRDANTQNLGTDDGRAKARDADNAIALLHQPTPTANNLLQQAATTDQPKQQQTDLKAAAAQQAKLADDLKLLAEHYKNSDAGQPEATRALLREAEKELGLKPTLDAEYAKAQALEKLAGLTPQAQLAELERALPNNKPMRRELSDIAKDTVQSAAADLQKAADKERQMAQQPAIEQAKHIAEQAQQLARQDVPAVAKQTGELAKPELADAGQKLASVAQNIPQDAAKPPAELAQAFQNQVAPLLQAAADLDQAATKLEQAAHEKTNSNPAAAKQAHAAAQHAKQASEHANQLAQQASQLATATNPATPREQAARIAEATKQLAQQDLPAAAKQAGEAAKPELAAAGAKLANVAQHLQQEAAKPADQLAQALQNQVAPLQQAAADLNNTAAKLTQKTDTATQQQVQQASEHANQLAQQAGQFATALNGVKPPPPAEQARQIATTAQQLARQDLPALAQQADPTAKPDLTAAGQRLETVAQKIPQDFAPGSELLAQQVQNQVAPLQQAATDLNNAAAKISQTAQTAQQQAGAAALALQQAKANNADESAVQQAAVAQQQAQAAAQQAQTAQQHAQEASQQAGQLAQQAGQLANALNQAQAQIQAVAQQPVITETVHAAGADVARAGRHEGRLGQKEAGRELQHLGQQIDHQTGAQVTHAAAAMTKADSPAQVQAAARTAHDAIQSPVNDLNNSLQQMAPSPGNPAPPQETPSQLAAAPEAAAKWMARALDSLDTALNPPAGQAAAPANQPLATQAAQAAAQAQAGSMMTARNQGLAPGEQPVTPGISAGGGLGSRVPGNETTPLPDANPTGGKWGKLPPKLARDLINSQHEGVSGQYREMVEMYFRAIADKAREKQP